MTREAAGIISLFAYAELFDYPLKESEIFSYYFGDSSTSEIDQAAVRKSLELLIERKSIIKDESIGFYFFPDKSATVGKRLEKEVSSRKILKKVDRIGRFLSILPWIRFIGVTGALASLNSPQDDDADLIILTRHKRLWLTRLLTFLVLKLFRLKKGQKNIRGGNALCINVWMDENYLGIQSGDRDLVVAFDLIRIRPVVDKDNLLEKILENNSWITAYLPFSLKELGVGKTTGEAPLSPLKTLRPIIFYPLKFIFDGLEGLAYRAELSLISKKFPRNLNIKVSPYRLWQHPTDNRGRILRLYKDNLEKRLSVLS